VQGLRRQPDASSAAFLSDRGAKLRPCPLIVAPDGPKRHHYRLYCLLDYAAKDCPRPLLVIVAGLDKPFQTVLSQADYKHVRMLGEEYLSRNPRSLA
jgi:hypothetical protein